MKWYNTDKTKMINLDAVNGYVYIPAKEYIEQNPTADDVNDFKMYGNRIELIIGGTPYIFRGVAADEIFNMLITETTKKLKKQLLKG